MTIQTLDQFRTTFAMDPVECEIKAKDITFKVRLKPLSSRKKDEFEASIIGDEGKKNLSNLRARLVSYCWLNGEDKPIGTDKEIGELRADVVAAIFDKVRELNGMDKEAVEEAGKD